MAPTTTRKRKRGQENNAADGNSAKPLASTLAPTPSKQSRPAEAAKKIPKREEDSDEEEDIVEDGHAPAIEPTQGGGIAGLPGWSMTDLEQLIERMMVEIPQNDAFKYGSRVERLDWSKIAFNNHSAAECKSTWNEVQKRIRHFRLLREILEDAKAWLSKPWTNFYRSQKMNRHPDMPRRPLTTYMLFYLDKKDKVVRENPGMDMPQVSKQISLMYKNLPEKKKQKYIEKAAKMRDEYKEKMDQFYEIHPEMNPKSPAVDTGKAKPHTPFMMFYYAKLEKIQHDTDFNRGSAFEACKEQWKNLPEKKKILWINQAYEEEQLYCQTLKKHKEEHPEFEMPPVKTILSKEEKQLRDRWAGKPEKPPNSGYSLYSRIMLGSAEMKNISSRDRLQEISRMWKKLGDAERKKYNEQALEMIDQYKLEYASYLESLSDEQRQIELESNMPRKPKPKPKKAMKEDSDLSEEEEKPAPQVNHTNKNDTRKAKKLYKNEPVTPPTTAYALFLQTFVTDANHIAPRDRKKEAPRYWQMLPESEKAKYRRRLSDMKQKYIQQYEKFIKSLSQEELAEYTVIKGNRKQVEGKEDDKGSDSDSDDSDNEESESGDEDSSSESDSESGSDSDSSDSDDSDSSSGSESE